MDHSDRYAYAFRAEPGQCFRMVVSSELGGAHPQPTRYRRVDVSLLSDAPHQLAPVARYFSPMPRVSRRVTPMDFAYTFRRATRLA